MKTALSTGKLAAMAWYELKDLPPGSDTIGDRENNSTLGIVGHDYMPKPAERAIRFVSRFYAEPMRSLDDEILIELAPASDAVIHAFEQDDGDVLVAGWLRTRVPGRQGDVGRGDHRDTRLEIVPVTVPRTLRGEATVHDALGDARPAHVRSRDALTTITLALEGGSIALARLAR